MRNEPSKDRASHVQIDELVRQLDADSEVLSSRRRELDNEVWTSLAGDHLSRLLSTPDSAIGYLSHPDARLRLAAIAILDRHFNRADQLICTWQQMSESDVDAAVRRRATLVLVRVYRGS